MRGRWLDALVVVILLGALAVRLTGLDQFIVADELRWTCRALAFGNALATRALSETFQTGHPGVLTMWVGSLTVPAASAPDAVATCLATEGATAPSAADAAQLAGLAAVLWRMRVGAALLNTAQLAAAYVLARRVLGPRSALFGLVLLAFDPFLLAHSRVLHLDAILSGLLLISVLALLAAFLSAATSPTAPPRRPSALLLALAGFAAGAALTQKVAALFLLPWAALALAVLTWLTLAPDDVYLGGWLRAFVRHGLIFGAALALAVLVIWPAAWADPLATAQGVIAKAAEEGGQPHQAGQFVGEEIVDDPGAFMYVLALLFRSSPWLLLGLPLGVWAMLRRQPGSNLRVGLLGLLTFALLFAILISFSPKKFDRYLLPVFPPLALVAGGGLATFADWLATRRGKQERPGEWLAQRVSGRGGPLEPPSDRGLSLSSLAFLAVVATTQLALVLPHAPYYLTYYNPLLGGGRAATRWLLVGWGEGYDQAAAYLNQVATGQGQTAVRGVSQFAPLYVGETRSAPGYRPYQTRYVVLYVNEVQRRRSEGLIQRYYDNPAETPLHVVTLHGIDYAWVYENTTARAPLAYLEANAQAGDALVVNGASLAAEAAPPQLPQARVYGHFGVPETAATLAVLPTHQRLWYVRYPAADPPAVLDALHEQAILDGEPRRFPDVEVWRFRAAPPADHVASADFGPLRLVGWGIETTPLRPGEPTGVSLAWQATEAVDGPVTVALELLDPEGRIVAVSERPVGDRALRPAAAWPVGERVETLIPLSVPQGTPPGEYSLRVGLQGVSPWRARLGTVVVEQGAAGGVEIPTVMDAPAGPGLRLAGHGLPPVIEAGKTLNAPLYWRADGPVTAATVDIAVRDVGGRLGPVTHAPLLATSRAGNAWPPGVVYQATRSLATPADMATGPARVEMMPKDAAGQPLLDAPIVIGPLWLRGQPVTTPPRAPQREARYRLANRASLLGYDVAQAAPGAPLDLTLYWRADEALTEDYTVFVHLLASDGRIIAQLDHPPGLGRYPTSGWQAGEIVMDPYRLDAPPGTPPGRYQLAIGWYTPAGRAEARDAAGQRVADDRILLDVDLQ